MSNILYSSRGVADTVDRKFFKRIGAGTFIPFGSNIFRVGADDSGYSVAHYDSYRVIRFEVRSGDNAIWDKVSRSVVDRAELVALGPGNRIPYGKKFEWEFNLLVQEGPEILGDWCVLAQMHQSGEHPTYKGGVNPPFSICWHTEGARRMVVLARSCGINEIPSNGYIKPLVVFRDDNYSRGVWVAWKLEMRFSWRGDALLRIWVDGQIVASCSGQDFALGYEWDAGPELGSYPQFGIYRASASSRGRWASPDANPMVVFFSNVAVSH